MDQSTLAKFYTFGFLVQLKPSPGKFPLRDVRRIHSTVGGILKKIGTSGSDSIGAFSSSVHCFENFIFLLFFLYETYAQTLYFSNHRVVSLQMYCRKHICGINSKLNLGETCFLFIGIKFPNKNTFYLKTKLLIKVIKI